MQLIGEETSASDGIPNLTDAPTWVVDPLDGTTNFVHRWVDLICLCFWCWTHANLAQQFFPKFFSERLLLAMLDVCIVGVMSQQVPFCVCIDWTCHQQSSCSWSGIQPHSWWGTQSHYLFFTFFFKELAYELPKSTSLKASVATHDLFGSLNVGREIELGFFFCCGWDLNSQLFTAVQGRGAFLNGKRINGQLLSEFHIRQLLDLHGLSRDFIHSS